TDVARFGQRRGVNDCKRHAQQARQGLCQQRLSGSGRSNQQDVRFLQFDVGFFSREFDSLVVVVDCYGKLLFRFVLPDDVLVEESFDLGRFWKVYVFRRGFVILILIYDVLAYADALIADEDSWSGDQLPDIILALVAE